jgi:hypothetical protein
MFSADEYEWTFCRDRDCIERDPVSDLQDRLGACLLLQQFKRDSGKMITLRSLLFEEGCSRQLSRMTDDAVVRQIAELLLSGRLHLHRKTPEQPATQVRIGKAETYVLFPVSERGPRGPAPPPPQPADPPTFSDVDSSAQAATLVGAAADGKPFCPE